MQIKVAFVKTQTNEVVGTEFEADLQMYKAATSPLLPWDKIEAILPIGTWQGALSFGTELRISAA